jgi:hypothetical protein
MSHPPYQYEKIRSKVCQFRLCCKAPTYGPRGETAQYCAKHCNRSIDVLQKSTICQYPDCQATRIRKKYAKFCQIHRLEPLPRSYLESVIRIRGIIKQPRYLRGHSLERLRAGIPDLRESHLLPPFRELIRGLPVTSQKLDQAGRVRILAEEDLQCTPG